MVVSFRSQLRRGVAMRTGLSVLAAGAAAAPLFAQPTAPSSARRMIPSAFASLSAPVGRELSGDRAHATVAFVEQFFRLPGNRGYDASIDTLAALLKAAGYVEQSSARPSDRLVYRVESRQMNAPAWTPDSATLTIAGRTTPLLRYQTNRSMIAINSWSTPSGGVTARVVFVGAGTDADLAKHDLKDAIVMVDGNVRVVYLKVMQRGARGVLAVQKLPAYNQQEKNTNSIQFTGIARDTTVRGFVIYLSAAARDSLKAALAQGDVQVRAMVATRFEDRPERTVVAEVRGSTRPDERFVYSAHVQEPGANDNASGVGLLAEMARTTAVMVKKGQANPARTLTFLWGDEIRSTDRFIKEDSVRRRGIKWGMSLDMVGENTALTGGTFLIEKMPDPSAVWVRGEDQHSEWGGSPIKAADIRSYWLNDFVRQRCLDRASTTGWVVKSNPFEGGSDHTPFLNARIPAVLLWHFTDQFYHTDRDRIEMVSAATLANVGNCALSTGLLLTAGTPAIARAALAELADVAVRELRTQGALSAKAVSGGAKAADERLIVETWRDYYLEALGRVPEMAISTGAWDADLKSARERVSKAAAEVLQTP
ncbi:MAG: M28 family peptidase [Gemmatimonadaceae bacterium]|nr:M28 family peptidase [Gemmatimonadaceae bacterium]